MRILCALYVLLVSVIILSCKSEKPGPITGTNPIPAISSFTPLTGPKGTIIIIQGENFGTSVSAVSLKINGLAAAVKSVKETEITAVVPDKCGLGALVLSVDGKELTSSGNFRYTYLATVSNFTGGQKGFADGAPDAVKFEGPYKIIFDSKETFYLTDQGNCLVRKIDQSGNVTTIAGTPHSGFQDGKGDQALMRFPIGIELAPDGTIYIADHQNNAIRKLSPDGTLTTLAGSPDREGSVDGDLKTASFKKPYGVKLDQAGTLWICDTENGLIRKISPEGQVTTFAGSTPGPGYADGKLREAKFYLPASLTFDEKGNVYVADKHNHCIRKITSDGMVTTFAGKPEQNGFKDGTAKEAMFDQPSNVQIDKLGNLYVTDLYNHCIRLIYPDGVVTTLAGKPGTLGYTQGPGAEARFYYPQGTTFDSEGNLFVTDSFNNAVRKITIE